MAKTKAGKGKATTAPRTGSTSAPTHQATPQNQQSPPPTGLDFEVSWSNFEKVKAHFKLSDSECHEVLVAHCGPNPSGQEFWKRFKKDQTTPGPAAPAAAPERTPQPAAAAAPETTPRPAAPEPEVPEPAVVEPPAKRARLRPMEVEDTLPDTQMECAADSDDADDDGDDESVVSTSKTSGDGPGGVPPGGAAVPDSPIQVLSAPTPDHELPRQQIPEDDPIRRDLERELAEIEKREMSTVPVPPNKPNPVEKVLQCTNMLIWFPQVLNQVVFCILFWVKHMHDPDQVSKAPSFQRMEWLSFIEYVFFLPPKSVPFMVLIFISKISTYGIHMETVPSTNLWVVQLCSPKEKFHPSFESGVLYYWVCSFICFMGQVVGDSLPRVA